MIIKKTDDGFLVKVYKDNLDNFDFLDKSSIQDLFQKILVKLLEKYELNGLLDVDVYFNDSFGLIIEIREFSSYFDEIDMHIQIHVGSVFLIEIDLDDIFSYKDVYYYKNKFYGIYEKIIDSTIIYKESEEIIEKGIKIC